MMAKRLSSGEGGRRCSIVDGKRAANGFYTCPELEAISIPEEFISPYSMPHEALTYEPSIQETVYEFKNGDKERKIHCNIELEEEEQNQLKEMQREARRQELYFFPSITVLATRYLSRARGDIPRALQLMVETQTWRAAYFANGPILAETVAADLKLGIVYFVGRDKALRPTMVCRANRIPAEWYKEKQTDKLIRMVIFCMEYMVRYMTVPGRVEGNNLIVDLKGLSATQVPISELKKLYSVMSKHYIGRVFKFYIVNLSWTLNVIAGAVRGILTDRQNQKLNILDNASFKEKLKEDFALTQLEQDYGGTRPTISDFFPFPVLPGSFAAGSKAPPNLSAPKDVHKVFSAVSCRGRLWDPKKSREENLRLDFTKEAGEILVQCGLPVPKEVEEKVKRASERSERRGSKGTANQSDGSAVSEEDGLKESMSGKSIGSALDIKGLQPAPLSQDKTETDPQIQLPVVRTDDADLEVPTKSVNTNYSVTTADEDQPAVFSDDDEDELIERKTVKPLGFFSCQCY
mmetsp:Transcript_17905/g.39328  ORF Transcript_17905/g.39328 Transcript_17905/m.39328 type:complete len:519 (-) Transcript_17905:271-1827(-)